MLEALDAIRVVGEHRVRLVRADRAHDVAEELARGLEAAIGIAEHDDVLDAHEVGRGALLGRAPLRELLGDERAVGGAGATVGAQHVRDFAPRRDPARDDAAGADLGVVGMREDDHRALGNRRDDLEPGSVHAGDSSSSPL